MQGLNTFADFQGIANRTSQRLAHRREARRGGHPQLLTDANQAFRQRLRGVAGFHECTGTELDVERQTIEPGSEFFRHDTRHDHRLTGDGSGHIAQGVEFRVSGADFWSGTDHGHAQPAHLFHGFFRAQSDAKSRDTFEFIERPTGDTQASTANHGHPQSIASQQGSDQQRCFVADSAG